MFIFIPFFSLENEDGEGYSMLARLNQTVVSLCSAG